MRSTDRERGGIFWKLLILVSLVLILGTVYLLRKPLLIETGYHFTLDEKLAPADAILVLGDDNYPGDRARHAAKLYRERWAPRVVASGHYLRPYASVAELIRRDLVQNGVADEHIIVASHQAANTREEAFALRRVIRQQRWRRVILVTSNYHTRRSRYIFRRILDPDTELLVSAAVDEGFPPESWWQKRGGVKLFLRELLAWPVALWEMSGEQKEDPHGQLAPAPAKP